MTIRPHAFVAIALILSSTTAIPAQDAKSAPDFTLKTADGKAWRLHDQNANATVVAFICCECPMSNGYLPTLATLANEYAKKGVTFVGVNPDDTPERIAEHAREFKIPYPVMSDEKLAATRSLGATVTPEVIVLDKNHVVRYRGRIDDGFSARMKAKPAVQRHDLQIALDEILGAKSVSLPETKAFGCPIDSRESPAVAKLQKVTYYKDVLPILQKNCQSCHRPGQVGPFSLMTAEQAKRWADVCLEEMQAKRMPPWKAADSPLLAHNRSLTPNTIVTFKAWIDADMPLGNPADAPPAVKFTDGWTLGEPDLVLEVPDDITIGATGRDHFRVVVLPTNLPEDKYITAMEVRPGNKSVVHHTLQRIDTTGTARRLQKEADAHADPKAVDHGPGYPTERGFGFMGDRAGNLGGWVPGMLPRPLPNGVGQKLPKGADICLQFHFHRTGKVETDKTKIGLYFAKEPVTEQYRTIPVAGLFFRIPAGKNDFRVQSEWILTHDVTAYRVTPHMHLLGKEIELTYQVPGGKETPIVRIPEWDYNWQEQYELKTPLNLPKGTTLRIRATFDNSADNPNNPSSPPIPVRLGEQTTNEMCFVFLGVSTAAKSQALMMPGFFGR